jgi:UrcA family protein
MNSITLLPKPLLAAVTALGLVNLCHAEEHAVTVHYRDLAISTPAGAAVLYKRIRFAADEACSYLDHGDLASKANKSACADQAIADAVVRVGEPRLLSVYEATHKLPPPVAQVPARVSSR